MSIGAIGDDNGSKRVDWGAYDYSRVGSQQRTAVSNDESIHDMAKRGVNHAVGYFDTLGAKLAYWDQTIMNGGTTSTASNQ